VELGERREEDKKWRTLQKVKKKMAHTTQDHKHYT
jgi:hypothetical protein